MKIIVPLTGNHSVQEEETHPDFFLLLFEVKTGKQT